MPDVQQIDEAERRAWKKNSPLRCRPLAVRIRYGFIRTHKPVLDDVPFLRVRAHGGLSPMV